MNSRKKVLFLITKATVGGAQKYVYDLATNVPRDRFEPIVAYCTKGKLAVQLEGATIRTVRVPSLGRDIAVISDIMSFFQIRRIIRHARPDIVHLNSSKAAALGALAARFAGTEVIVFTVHGWPFKERRNILARTFIYFISWLTAALCTHTIVVSKTDERLARRMWKVRRTVRHIPLGQAVIPFASPNDAFQAMFGQLPVPTPRSSTIRILSNSELSANKGIGYALDALEYLHQKGTDFMYLVVGDGEERARLEALAKSKGIAQNVFFPGHIEGSARYIRGFDVFLMPSLKEGMPYALMEAAAAGVPVVTTDVVRNEFSHFPQFIFVPPAQSLALADAIERAATTPHQKIPENPFPLGEMVQSTIVLYLPAQEGR